jgi:ribosome-binding factor A
MSQRTDRVDELLREEIGSILIRDVRDPRIGFATVTRVETTPDLRHARVWVSIIGQRAERDETLRALERAMPFVRHELGGRLRLRRIPEFQVRLDDSAERGTRVLHLLQELEAGNVPDDLPSTDESLPTPVTRIRPEGEPAPEPGADGEPPARRPRGGRPAGGRQGRGAAGSGGRRPASRKRTRP